MTDAQRDAEARTSMVHLIAHATVKLMEDGDPMAYALSKATESMAEAASIHGYDLGRIAGRGQRRSSTTTTDRC